MKILVTGASGFIGKHLVERLLKLKHNVTILTRKTSNIDDLPKNIKIKYGDITNPKSLEDATKNIDLIFHLAGVIHPVNVPDSFYWDVNVKGTENLIKAAIKNKVKHFIYCSSVTCYGVVEDEKKPIKEDYPCYGQNIYGKTKYEGENIVKKYKIPFTIIRPARVYGPGDYTLLPLFRLVKKGITFDLGKGKSTMMPVYIDDLIDAFVSCINNKKAIGKTYNISGDEVISKSLFMKLIARELKKRTINLSLPVKPTLAFATIIEYLFRPLNIEPPISRKKLKFFLLSRIYDIGAAKKDLNYKPRFNLEKGLSLTIDWAKNNNLI